MKSPKISIIIPSFNKVGFIGKTLESIVSQNYSNLEVIIQDGGSTDGTLKIIKNYAKSYTKIFRYESEKDNGQLDAINKGFNKATGEILTFINSDDIFVSGAFSIIESAYNERPEALWLAGRGTVIDSKGHEIAKPVTAYKNFLLSLNSRFWLLTTNYLMQPSVFITRKAWEKFGPFTGTQDFVMEYNFWLKLSKIQMPFVISDNLSKFRLDDKSKSKQLTTQILIEDEKVIRKYTNNQVILFLHKINNLSRKFFGQTI